MWFVFMWVCVYIYLFIRINIYNIFFRIVLVGKNRKFNENWFLNSKDIV